MPNNLSFNEFVKLFKPLVVALVIILISSHSGLAQLDIKNDNIDSVNQNELETATTQGTLVSIKPIEVSIKVEPSTKYSGYIHVPVDTDLTISAIIKHPSHYSNQLTYKWSTKDGTITSKATDGTVTYKFTKTDVEDFVAVDVFDPVNKVSGSAKSSLQVLTPLKVLEPSGKLFLERGELLNITLRYTGSPPYYYCYKFCTPTDNLPCDFCFKFNPTSQNSIQIINYFHLVGNYTLEFQIMNQLNITEKRYVIKINDAIRGSNLPIAPIVSTILAVLIIISGIGLHIKFRDSQYATETANFDFFNDNEEEWEQELSFIQRVKYLFCSNQHDDSDEASYLLRRDSSGRMNGYRNNNDKTT